MSDFIPSQQYDEDEASLISEDSKEPYFDIRSGRIVPAREAWAVLAAEGHPKYKHLASGSSRGGEIDDDTMTPSADSVFRTATGKSNAASNDDGDQDGIPIVASCSSGGGPTQLSIDRALHPDLNDPKRGTSPSNHGPKKDTPLHNSADDEDEETDPIIIRAKAMAMAAQNGKHFTPEQLQLIAQPDVQQQKLIEEAKRMANSRHGQNKTHHGGNIINLQQGAQDLQQLGKDIKNFIKTEQGKPPSQWTADLGKFFEDQTLKKSTNNADNGDEVSATTATTDGEGKRAETPKRKKMEGFGSDPNALLPQQPQSSPTFGQRLSSLRGDENAGGGAKWPINMPPLPMLNKIIGAEEEDSSEQQLEARISGVLWKRRSGFGKHSVNAWEKRRVELRGTKLVYYSTLEEAKEDEKKNATGEDREDGGSTPRDSNEQDDTSTPREAITSLKMGIEQAALAAEQQIQTAKDGLSRFAAGIDILKSPSGDTPRGILDLSSSKERVSVSASMGHSGAPTPFCLSLKVKSMTQWKFAFDSHGMMMEWLAILTDVIVESSLSIAEKPKEGNWELENYCIKRKDGQECRATDNETGTVTREVTARASGTALSSRSVVSDDDRCGTDDNWMLAGNNLYIACAAVNGALLLARSSSTSIDQFWKLFVFTNFGIWKLCTRPKVSSVRRQIKSVDITTEEEIPAALPSSDKSFKPIAGSTTVKVSSIVKNTELDLPSWLPISYSTIGVRSHGYLTTKKKIPCPGELYECIAVDCFSSNTRFPDVATRVKLPDVTFDDDDTPKTWRSPDIFIASLAIPTEAPRFGQSTDDGPGVTFVGYFRMKEETRAILRRVTAPGYNPSTDESESDIDVQKRIVNGVRLWEEYCIRAPSDPTFQARFKLIPSANLEELGIPAYISKYNGKPVLIKRNQVTGFFTDYPSLNAMSFEISFHPFPYLFKQAMSYLKDYFDSAIGTFGFVIEGRNDDELPEVMIGVMKGCYAGPRLICKGEDFFSGRCEKSSAAKKMD